MNLTYRRAKKPLVRLLMLFCLLFFGFLGTLGVGVAAPPSEDSAHTLVRAALEAMGGKAKWASVQRVRSKGIATQYLLEQSVRFEGPYLANLADFEETCDFDALEHQVKAKIRGAQFDEWFDAEYAFGFNTTFSRKGKSLMQTPQESAERLYLGPERILLLAESAHDLRRASDVSLNKISHQRVHFTLNSRPVTLFLNRYTHLPTVVETVSPRQGFWAFWGDVTTRTEYSNWHLLPNALRYPFSWNVERNNLPQSQITLTEVNCETASGREERSAENEFARIQSALSSYRRPEPPPFRSIAVAEGVYQFPGGFNTHVVVQSDGLIVIEAVNGSEFNENFLAELEKRFPGKSVKALIVTDDAWPHCGGLRPFVARGIPVYALAENQEILEKMVTAPHRFAPDALQRAPRKFRFMPVRKRLTLGDGPNRLEIIPLRGAESERMVSVYFPERRLLYGSDLIQRAPDGKLYSPQLAQELIEMTQRENLQAATVFAMHSGPLAWQRLLEERKKAAE